MLKALNHRILFSLVMGAGLIGSAVLAHHGVSGQYDSSSPIVLSGMVTRATFAPPHPVLSVRVEGRDVPALDLNRPDEFTGPFIVREEDVGEVREIEFSPVGEFYALGDRIRVGDRVTVLALRNCRPPHELRSSWIRLSSGQIVSYSGGLHRRVDGCR